MKYLSIDIETTGLNPETCNIIEFGAVLDDTSWWGDCPVSDLPFFHAYVLPTDGIYKGEVYALAMNSEIFKRIAEGRQADLFLYEQDLGKQFQNWLNEKQVPEKTAVAGKNFASFDQRFLERLPKWNVKFSHRSLDPAMLYFNPLEDSAPPSMKVCMQRAGMAGEVAHTAVADAQVVIELIRKAYNK